MTKNIILILSFILIATSAMAQVRMQYDDYLCGKINEDDLTKVSVANFVSVSIDFIYKVKVVDKQGKVVLTAESEIITCERGNTDYAVEKIKGFRIVKKEIDLSSYSGILTIQSMIVHPQDTRSIIASVDKLVYLKDGISMTEDGKVLTDPRLFDAESKIMYGGKFELKDLYEKMFFQNDNFSVHCTDLIFVIAQDRKEIYRANLIELCLPPGESNLSEAQKAEVDIILDEYETRNPDIPILVQFKNGEHSAGSWTIEPVNHYNHGMEYERYTNQSIGLSFEFINHAANTFSPPNAFNTIVIFDKNGKVSDAEQYPFRKDKKNQLGINGPDGCTRSRSDINGMVVVQVLDRDHFTAAQWLAYIAFVNNLEDRELKSIQSNGLEVIAPNNKSNTIENLTYRREYSSYTFAIKDIDKVILFQVSYTTKIPTVDNLSLQKNRIDVDKILNSVIYNKISFQFEFNDSGEFKSLSLSSLGPTVNQQTRQQQYDKFLKYQWVMRNWDINYNINVWDPKDQIVYSNLDSLISKHQITEMSTIPKFKIITPEQDPIRKYETIHWDSMQVSFSHRVDDTHFSPLVSKRPEDYFYNNKDKIESWSQAPGKEPNAEKSQKYTYYRRIFPVTLKLHPVYGQNIGISRMANDIGEEQLIKAMVGYENSNQFSEVPSIKVIETNGWKIYISTQLINQGRRIVNSNVVYIDSGSFLYRVYISGGFKSDILHLLNSLKIEGKQFHFQYNDARQLENIEII